jgi:hypothetical protein
MLPGLLRQAVAGAAAAVAFLALYLGARLIWPVALGLAAVVLVAVLLVIRRRPDLSEQMLSDRISAQDVAAALDLLDEAARRLTAAAGRAPLALRDDLQKMAEHIASIRTEIARDPADLRRARRFTGFFLPQIVQTVDAYVDLAARAKGDSAARLEELGQRIRDWGPAVERIDQACMGSDLVALEAQIDALGFQMKTLV